MRYSIRPRIRIVREDGTIVLGPGKADLLAAIGESGSIRAAAESLGMSYMRAWTLVRTMNAAFRSPLVEKVRGGNEKGYRLRARERNRPRARPVSPCATNTRAHRLRSRRRLARRFQKRNAAQ